VGSRQKSRVSLLAYALMILFPVIFFAVVEGVLRVADLYNPAGEADPFIGLLESHRVFLPDETRGVRYIDRYRAQSFNVQTFPMQKEQQTFRIFCLGGSAAYGYPFGAPVSFSRWMADACRTLWPGRRFEVINAAGMSYGSYRVRALVKEIVEYAPDLVVLYSGHNEFIEKEFYIQSAATRLVGVRGFLSKFHLYNFLKQTILGLSRKKQLSDASFDEFGLHVSRRENVGWTAEERQTVLQKYHENIATITKMLKKEGVPMLLMVPAPNVGDWRPEHSVLTPSLTEESVAAWSCAYAEGIGLQEKDRPREAIGSFERALAIDDRHAELHYRLGQCWEALGSHDQALACYQEALDRDDVPIRVNSFQRAALHGVAREERPFFADAWSELIAVAPSGIPGSNLFWDYCHLNVKGHQQVAALACSALVASGLLPAPGDDLAALMRQPVRAWDLRVLGMADPDSFDLRALPRGADGLWWLGNCAERQGAREQAGRWYRQSLDANPNHPGSLIGLAIQRSRTGRQGEAIELCRKALGIYQRLGMRPMVTRAHSELGVFYSRAGRPDAAADEFREVLRRNPVSLGVHVNLGKVLIAMGDLQEAEEILREGIRQLPRERGLHKQLGRVYRRQGRETEAIAQYEEELRLAPGDFFAHDGLGDLYRTTGKSELAAAQWETCLRLRPDSREVALKLAELYESLGRAEEARVLRDRLSLSGGNRR
jgi:tetratricopeptide (TPR) repeat protein